MRILLRDLAPGQTYGLQFRSDNGDAVSEWSQIQRFTTTNDTTPPGAVANLSWYDSGSSYVGQWDKITVDALGAPLLDFRYYRVTISASGFTDQNFFVVGERFEFTPEMNISSFGSLQTTLTITVRAVDLTYNESTPVSLAASPLNPPTPSTPVIGAYLGLLTVGWNGLSSTGGVMPANFDYLEIHVSATSGFTPSTTTLAGRILDATSGSLFTLSNLTYGTTYYIRTIVVNKLKRKSTPSAQASGVPTRISGLDIQDGQISVSQINFADKIGGINAYYTATAPVQGVNGVSLRSGDVWYNTSAQYAASRYNGTTFVLAPEIGVISGTKIIAGTLTSNAVGTNLLIASSANIADAVIDSAKISSLAASKITTGEIAANQRIIAGPVSGTHAEMTSTGFRVYGLSTTTGLVNEVIRLGTDTDDYFAVTKADGSYAATIDQAGTASLNSLTVKNDPTIQGVKLSAMLDKYPKGVVGFGYYQMTQNNIQAEYGEFEVSFTALPGRMYRVTIYNLQWAHSVSTATALFLLRMTSASVPGWTELRRFYKNDLTGPGFQKDNTDIGILIVSPEAGLHRLCLSAYSASAGLQAYADTTMLIEDIGPAIANTAQTQTLGGSPATPPAVPAVQQYTKQYATQWSMAYKSDGSQMSNYGGNLYQGYGSSFNGNQMSLQGWDSAAVIADLAGATVNSVNMFVTANHWYNNAGGTGIIGAHGINTTSAPGSIGGVIDPGRFQSPGWPKPGDRWLDITAWGNEIKGGSVRGMVFGPGPSNSTEYYGYFAGNPVLQITYTK